MERVVVMGCSGAGKSTLAVELGRRLDLPVIHLDWHFWQAGWVETPKAAWAEKVRELLQQDRWIMDGNFGGTMALRMAKADAIIFLDFPRRTCLRRVLLRWWTYRGRTRPDLPEGCPEKIDLEFLRWIWNFRRRSRPAVLEALERFRAGRVIEVLHNPAEVRCFLQHLSPPPPPPPAG